MIATPHRLPQACLRFPAVRDPHWVESSFGHL